ncbi:hypothetical protein [Pseudomonas silesiensis]|uniref:hypothetical protein n=1 Tax=Pseudomonas silesiensis TaxID=1853130 RepID=UPI0030DB6377
MMRDIKTREGFEFWDKLNALPRYAFLLSPSGNSVQKFEDKALGNWIDVHEAQKIVDQAQERISELRDELGAAKGEYDRAVNKVDALQLRLNAADQRIDELTQRKTEPVEWGAPKTVRQLIQQLETLDQELRPLSMLRVPGDVFEDGKERTRAVHLSFSHERVDGQWLAPFKGGGEKVLAFWCRIEQPATAFGFPVVVDPALAPDEIRLELPATRRTDEVQFKGMIEARGGKFAIMIDEANAHYGWTFQRHPDGMWVSGRKATEVEMHAARTHAGITHQL